MPPQSSTFGDTMNQYSISIFGNVQTNRTEAEISLKSSSGETSTFVGIVYENEDGWVVEHENNEIALPKIEIERAKSRLLEYINRKGIEVDPELTAAGHSLLLMLKKDGTAMGQKLKTCT